MPRRYFYYIVIIGCLTYILAWLIRYEPPTRGPIDPDAFADKAHESVNRVRLEAGLRELETSRQLQDSLAEYIAQDRLDPKRLQDVFDHIERKLPQVHELAVNLIFNPREEQLLKHIGEWDDLGHGQHTHYATWLFRDEEKRMLGCLSVLVRELPRLELPQRVDIETPAFFDLCRICGEGHGISLSQQAQKTVIVTCPHCERPYNLIATDANGEWRRATQFFGGLQAPELELDRGNLSKMEQLMRIWTAVAEKCQYKTDAQRVFGSDSWELPIETWRDGHGDCEDTSLLLTEMLVSNGFEARVALGDHEGEGHAWCVVRIDGNSYLLESTWEDIDQLSEPPNLDKIAMNYEPKYLFDGESIYFLQNPGWTADYWSDKRWREIGYPRRGNGAESVARAGK